MEEKDLKVVAKYRVLEMLENKIKQLKIDPKELDDLIFSDRETGNIKVSINIQNEFCYEDLHMYYIMNKEFLDSHITIKKYNL